MPNDGLALLMVESLAEEFQRQAVFSQKGLDGLLQGRNRLLDDIKTAKEKKKKN